MGTAKRHHEVNKVNGCGRPFGRLARSRHFPSSDPMGARGSKIRERQLYIALHVGRGEHIAPATVRALVEKGVRPFFKDDVQTANPQMQSSSCCQGRNARPDWATALLRS